jgi:Tfp pilus assembly protein PilP
MARPATAKSAAAPLEKEVAETSPTPPPAATFKPLGYVEKNDGQVEAIISQDDRVCVVHIGELIAGRYRVRRISPESVEAVEEMAVAAAPQKVDGRDSSVLSASVGEKSFPMSAAEVESRLAALPVAANQGSSGAQPNAAAIPEPLGYVEKADGRAQFVVADGENVRLVPKSPAVAAAVAIPTKPEGALTAQVSNGGPVSRDRRLPERAGVQGLAIPTPRAAIRTVSFQPPERAVAESVAGMSQFGIPPAAPLASLSPGTPGGAAIVSTPVLMVPIGYVEKAGGELDAVLSLGDAIYVVRQGDYFAGRYRAVRVSPEAVEAVEESPHDGLPPPLPGPPLRTDLLATASQDGLSPPLSDALFLAPRAEGMPSLPESVPREGVAIAANVPLPVREDRRTRRRSVKTPDRKLVQSGENNLPASEPTLVFQALGYIENTSGEIEAIVAEGSRVYLVKQGDAFAEQYRAVSVDPAMVLAVRAPPEDKENLLGGRTEFGAEFASKRVQVAVCFVPSRIVDLSVFREACGGGSSGLGGQEVDFLAYFELAGLDSHWFVADNSR